MYYIYIYLYILYNYPSVCSKKFSCYCFLYIVLSQNSKEENIFLRTIRMKSEICRIKKFILDLKYYFLSHFQSVKYVTKEVIC